MNKAIFCQKAGAIVDRCDNAMPTDITEARVTYVCNDCKTKSTVKRDPVEVTEYDRTTSARNLIETALASFR